MPENQGNGSYYGQGSCLVQSSSLGISIYGMSRGSLSAGVRQPLFVPGDLHYWDGLRALEVSPNLYDFGQWNVQNCHGLVGTVLICGSSSPSLEGVWPRTLRTEV